jgi:hypothetical protein
MACVQSLANTPFNVWTYEPDGSGMGPRYGLAPAHTTNEHEKAHETPRRKFGFSPSTPPSH